MRANKLFFLYIPLWFLILLIESISADSIIYIYIYLIVEFFIIVYLYQKYGPLNLLLIATLVYNAFFTLPYLFNSHYDIFSNAYSSFLYEPEFVNLAIMYFILFKVCFNVAYLFFYIPQKNRETDRVFKANAIIIRAKRSYINLLFVLSAFLFLIVQILIGVGIDNLYKMLWHGERFSILNPTISNLAYSVSFIIFFVSSIMYFEKYINILAYVFIFFTSFLYPFINSSRAMAIPFATIGSLSLVYGRKIEFVVFSLAAVFFLNFAFAKRGGTNLVNFLGSFNFIESLYFILISVSNLPTLTKTLQALADGYINVNLLENIFIYPLYLLPLPALVFSQEFFLKVNTLTYYFNYPIGITADIVSESLLFFGNKGPLIFGIFWGSILGVINKRFVDGCDNKYLRIMVFITSVYFLFGTCTYPSRHSSRFLVYFLSFYAIYHLLKPHMRKVNGALRLKRW